LKKGGCSVKIIISSSLSTPSAYASDTPAPAQTPADATDTPAPAQTPSYASHTPAPAQTPAGWTPIT
jgi:hypothetical protein